jgi:riboflavin kinase / FMN adenylyltransferase
MRIHNADDSRSSKRGSVVAIGVFDGVHRGHQAVLRHVVGLAREHDLEAIVVTFDPTPAEVLAPERAPKMLASLDDRLGEFEALGIDEVRIVQFSTEASHEEAVAFVDRVVVAGCEARIIVVGEDFHFGRNRQGNVDRLRMWGETRNFTVSPVTLVGDEVHFSSTRARVRIAAGEVAEACEILGRPFRYRNVEVVHGDARGGAELGFPTANIEPSMRLIRPALGIYAGFADLADGSRWAAAISVGKRPQFYEDGSLLIEAYLCGFSGDLYGQQLTLSFLEFLRGEMKFDSVEALVEQMHRDVKKSEEVFASYHG